MERGTRAAVVAVSVGSLLLAACGSSGDKRRETSDKWLTYEAPSGAFSIEYPEDFEYLSVGPGDFGAFDADLAPDEIEGVIFADEKPSESALREALDTGGFWLVGRGTDLRVSVMRLGSTMPLDAEVFTQTFRDESARYSGYEELHFREVSVDGATGYDYAFEYLGTTEDGEPIGTTQRVLLVGAGENLYMVGASASSEEYEEQTATVDRFFKSFRLDTTQVTSEPEPELPVFDAACDEVIAAVTFYGNERVFQHQIDDLLSGGPGEPSKEVRSQAVLLMTDLWQLCGLEVPQSAQEVAEATPGQESDKARVLRSVLQSRGIDALEDVGDETIDFLGEGICNTARPLQPLDTDEIVDIGRQIEDMVALDDSLDAAELFFATVGVYCPELDMSG